MKYRAVSCPLSVALLLSRGRKLSSPSSPTPSRHELCRLPYPDYPQYTLLPFVLNSAPSFSNFAFVILLFPLFFLLCSNRRPKYTRMSNCINLIVGLYSFCRITSVCQPTNAPKISHKTLLKILKHSDMFRSCQIIIRELCSLLKL